MLAATAFYALAYLITFAALCFVLMHAKQRLLPRSYQALRKVSKNCGMLLCVAGVVSMFGLYRGIVPTEAVFYVCLPLYFIVLYNLTHYFRLLKQHKSIYGK